MLFAAIVVCCASAPISAQTAVARTHTETLLAPFPAAAWDSATISPNARRVAYVKQTAAGQQVVVNGQEEKAYQKVAGLAFSPDSRQLAYAASDGAKWLVVVNGKEQGPYGQVGLPTFSPDSQHLAYVAMLADRQRVVVVDGKPGKPCEMVFEGIVVFSPDSRRMAYGARKADGWFVVIVGQASTPAGKVAVGPAVPAPDNGKRPAQPAQLLSSTEFGPYEFLGSSTGIQFSRDGRRLAFAGQVSKKWSVILDGKPQGAYDNLGPLVFSPDGKRIAYAAMRKGGEHETWQVVAALTPSPSPKAGEGKSSDPSSNGEEGKSEGKPVGPFDAIGEDSLVFSPNGNHLAYAAQTGQRWCLVLDGRPGEAYDGIAEAKFSPTSQLLAYVAKRQTMEAAVTVSLSPRAVGPAVPASGADRQRPAQPALPKENPPRLFDRIGGGTLVFSPSGRRLAYVARSGRWSFVVADGNRKPRYDMVGYLTFSPDGRWPVYAAIRGKKAVTVVEDKEATHQYDAIWMPRGEALRFVAPSRFRYVAVKGGNLYAVEEQLD